MKSKQTSACTKRRILKLSFVVIGSMSLTSYSIATSRDTASKMHYAVAAEQRVEPVEEELSPVPEFQRQRIAFDLAKRVLRIVTGRRGFSDRRGRNPIAVTFSGDGKTIIVDLGAAIGAIADDRAMDDLRQDIQLDFEGHLKEFGFKYVVFRYGGKTFDEVLPRVQRRDQSSIDASSPVIVKASQGLHRTTIMTGLLITISPIR